MKVKGLPRVWHPYWTWEEVAHGMWSEVADRKEAVEVAVMFTGDHAEYGRYMRRVVDEWPISCENALTNRALNHRAWIGHAAAALAHSLPEDVTREAWSKLTDEQRTLANREAERAICRWYEHYTAGRELRIEVAGALL